MINESSPHKVLQKRMNNVTEYPVPPLDKTVRRQIVTELFEKYNKILVDEHMEMLLAKESSENPLWLSVACEELRVFGQFQKIAEKIKSIEDDLLGWEKDLFLKVKQPESLRRLTINYVSLSKNLKRSHLASRNTHVISNTLS